jgi:cell division septal protein FtsQ
VHAGRLHWIDEEGVPIGIERQAVAPRAPVISGLSPEEIATMRERPSPRAGAALALIRTLLRSGSPLASEISEIDMSWSDGPVLYTVDGIEVRLGNEGWESRLQRLEGVLAQIARAGEPVTSIDLRFRDQVVLNGGASR